MLFGQRKSGIVIANSVYLYSEYLLIIFDIQELVTEFMNNATANESFKLSAGLHWQKKTRKRLFHELKDH